MVGADVKDRILKAAQALVDKNEPTTVDAVRRLAKTSMNDTVLVMREWRRAQSAVPAPVEVAVPEAVTKAGTALMAQIWKEAHWRATTSLLEARQAWEIEKERLQNELAEQVEAVDRQTADTALTEARWLEAQAATAAAVTSAEVRAAEAARQIAALMETAHDAATREQGTRKLAEDLKTGMTAAQAAEAAAREEAAALRGEVVAQQRQIASLMQTINAREMLRMASK
jgi:hypothetical protein